MLIELEREWEVMYTLNDRYSGENLMFPRGNHFFEGVRTTMYIEAQSVHNIKYFIFIYIALNDLFKLHRRKFTEHEPHK